MIISVFVCNSGNAAVSYFTFCCLRSCLHTIIDGNTALCPPEYATDIAIASSLVTRFCGTRWQSKLRNRLVQTVTTGVLHMRDKEKEKG